MSDKIENAIIFTGGNAPKKHIIPNIPPHIPPDRANCMIIAVDAGCEVCETWGIMPNVIVGDFDSYPLERIHHTFPQAKIYTLHTNKAHTDTEVALMYAHKYSKNITVVGVSNRIEVWDKKKWEDFYNSSKQNFEEIAENIIVDI